MVKAVAAAALAAIFASPATAQAGPDFGTRLAQVRTFAAADGEKQWTGYGTAPFGFLLVEPERELLLCRDQVPDGFTALGTDPATGCKAYTRARSGMPDTFLAAMPMFGPPSVIVMGTPKSTGRSEADWTRVILHEHFHQWQNALPDYYPRTLALNLTGGDTTGMWMLNYPFPYKNAEVAEAHAAASRALADAVTARWTPAFYGKFDDYLQRRWAFEGVAGKDHWRYAELQLWQEGVARWSEITLGKAFPDAAVAQGAAQLEEQTIAELRSPNLATNGREFAYAYGAAEAMLMEACGPGWRRDYPATLELRSLLERSRRECGRAP